MQHPGFSRRRRRHSRSPGPLIVRPRRRRSTRANPCFATERERSVFRLSPPRGPPSVASMASHLHLAAIPRARLRPHRPGADPRRARRRPRADPSQGLRLLLEIERRPRGGRRGRRPRSAAAHVNGRQPNVLVLDLSMPGGSSIEAIGRAARARPGDADRGADDGGDPVFAQRALAAGALGFVTKDLADGELRAARSRGGARRGVREPAAGQRASTRCTARSPSTSSRRARSRCCG